jgi:tRNA (cytidine32/uridine32-2'-O)-methyltransferase
VTELRERFTVVLVRPTESGNVGATARAMANCGLSRLVLVEPAAAIDRVARAFAVGAGGVLDGAARVPSLSDALAPFQRIVGTTTARDRQLDIPIAGPRAFAERASREPAPLTTALVFGPERTGLNNDELSLCGELIQIPTAPDQPSLNLSQAVLLVAHALYLASPEATPLAQSSEPPATTAEIAGLFEHVREALERVGFTRDDTAEGVLRDLRQLGARAGLTGREVQILRGICRRTLRLRPDNISDP